MNKLQKIIDTLSEEDLVKIKRDLVAGNVDRLINEKLNKISYEKLDNKKCPVCGGTITENNYSLEFGASYLRKRAYFDAVDCLEYFIYSKLKKHELKH